MFPLRKSVEHQGLRSTERDEIKKKALSIHNFKHERLPRVVQYANDVILLMNASQRHLFCLKTPCRAGLYPVHRAKSKT
jgi:hypothetical protein